MFHIFCFIDPICIYVIFGFEYEFKEKNRGGNWSRQKEDAKNAAEFIIAEADGLEDLMLTRKVANTCCLHVNL